MKDMQWKKDGDRYVLKNNDETFVSLYYKRGKIPEFKIGGSDYKIIKKGFWNAAFYVMANDTEILKLNYNSWGTSKGKISFADGEVYTIDFINTGGLQMRILNGPSEILIYGMAVVNGRPAIFFNLGTSSIYSEKLLVLSAFGFICFCSLMSENFAADNIPLMIKD